MSTLRWALPGCAALVVIAAGELTGILGGTSLTAHMAGHLLLLDAAPVLLLLALRGLAGPQDPGAPSTALRPSALVGASVALVVVWHVPAAFDAAQGSVALHLVEHASFLAAGLLLWLPVIGLPRRRAIAPAAVLALTATGRLPQAVLGNVLLWSPGPVYARSTLDDQRLSAAVMMGEGLVVGALLAAWLLHRLVAEEQERQRRLEAPPVASLTSRSGREPVGAGALARSAPPASRSSRRAAS